MRAGNLFIQNSGIFSHYYYPRIQDYISLPWRAQNLHNNLLSRLRIYKIHLQIEQQQQQQQQINCASSGAHIINLTKNVTHK